MSCAFVHMSLKHPKLCSMRAFERSCLKLFRHTSTNSCCVNFCRHTKISRLHFAMKLLIFVVSLYVVSISSGMPTLLWVLQKHRRTSCSIACQLSMEFSGRLVDQVKAAPLTDCPKSCNIVHPLW